MSDAAEQIVSGEDAVTEAIAEQAASLSPEAPTVAPEATATAPERDAPRDWRESLPEPLRDNPVIKDTKDVEGLAQRLVDAQSYIRNAVRIPGPDAPPEDMEAFFTKLREIPGVTRIPGEDASDDERAAFFEKMGRPADAGDYEFKRPEMVPEDFPISEEMLSKFVAAAHRAGLTNAQAEAVYGDVLGYSYSKYEESQKLASDQTRALQAEWGAAYKDKVRFAQDTIAAVGGEDLQNLLVDLNLSTDPVLMRTFAEIGERFGEKRIAGVLKSNQAVRESLTPEELRAQASELGRAKMALNQQMRDAKISRVEYTDRLNALLERETRVYAQLYPEDDGR